MLVQERAGLVMRQQIERNLVQSTKFTAETFTEYFLNIEAVAQIMAEYVMDRIVGYPNEGWEDDAFVPFFDTISQRNVYPLNTDPLPLDWNVTADLNAENAKEMLQERSEWVQLLAGFVTTSTGSFYLRGGCDPDAKPEDLSYLEGCSAANNAVRTGGVFAPSPTAFGLYQKSGAISVLWRPLYESHPDVLLLGMYFVNSGAGAMIMYQIGRAHV